MLTIPRPFGGLVIPTSRESGPAVFEYLGFDGSPSASITYTFFNCSLGDPSPDRLVIVGAIGNRDSSQHLSSVTIAGSAATLHVNPTGDWAPTGLASRVVPTGATATIEITFSQSVDRCIMFWGTLKNYRSATPLSTDGLNSGTLGSSAIATLDVLKGGVAIYVAAITPGSSGIDMVWSNATELGDVGVGDHLRGSFAVHNVLANQSGRAATASWSGSFRRGISAAAWR